MLDASVPFEGEGLVSQRRGSHIQRERNDSMKSSRSSRSIPRIRCWSTIISSSSLSLFPVLVLLMTNIASTASSSSSAAVVVDADGTTIESESSCRNDQKECEYWASLGECEKNPEYMRESCQQSCNACGSASTTTNDTKKEEEKECVDFDDRCAHWIGHGRNPYCIGESETYLYLNCPKSCGNCGILGTELEEYKQKRRLLASVGGDERLLETPYGYAQQDVDPHTRPIQEFVLKMEQYMSTVVWVEPKYEKVRQSCKVRHDSCAYYQALGYCDAATQPQQNIKYMRQNCAPFCGNCEELDFFHWCPLNTSVPLAIQSGELHPMFERILHEPQFQSYQPRALRQPKKNSTTTTDEDQPYVIILDSFLSEEECDALIELGQSIGYAESVDTGAQKSDGSFSQVKTTWRTSSTAWCSGENGCIHHEIPTAIAERVQSLTGIPQENAEHLQLLNYHEDQFYKYHHDCTPHHKERQMGPRVLTFFLYLNTVDVGGGTQFPKLLPELTVQPKKGRAVIWPNVLNDQPTTMDPRTAHQALPVEPGGIKFAANYWIHQRNWREVYKRGCI